eukprot:2639516-Prorocentrum_lima.AAC.1
MTSSLVGSEMCIRDRYISCTLFPTGTQTIRNRSSNAVAAGSSTSILESDLIHFLSCGAWILIPGDQHSDSR